MIDEIRGLLDQYAQWVRDKSVLREVNDQYVEITTPYLDRHNDYTQIYVRRDNGAFLLTDGGETIQDLRASGCDLETSNVFNTIPGGSAMFAAPVSTNGTAFESGVLQRLPFPPNVIPTFAQSTPDGQRFLVAVSQAQQAPRMSISVVLNWPASLKP